MLAIVAVIVFYVIIAILAGHGVIQPRLSGNRAHRFPLEYKVSSSSASDPLRAPPAYFTVSVSVGASLNLSLVLDTSNPDILILPGRYSPSATSEDLYQFGNDTFSLDGNATDFEVEVEAMSDQISIDGLTVPSQIFASMPSLASDVFMVPQVDQILNANASGVMGLLAATRQAENALGRNPSWTAGIQALRQIPSNRFALLLQTPGSAAFDGLPGEMIFGTLEQSDMEDGTLAATALIESQSSTVLGTVLVGDRLFAEEQALVFASGAERVYGPKHMVQKIFDAAGITSTDTEDGRLVGYYQCDSPPTIGFGFPYNIVTGDGTSVFAIDAQTLGTDQGNGACMAVVEGLDELDHAQDGQGRWILGHAFMQGKYVDFNFGEQSIGVGMLSG